MFHRKISPVSRMTGGGVSFEGKTILSRTSVLGIMIALLIISFIALTTRLFQLTVTKGGYYKRLSEANRIKELYIEPKYGTIRDRKGFVLVQSKQSSVASMNEYIRSRRIYSYPEETAHLIGYRQIANDDDIKKDNCERKLVLGEKIGKKGVQGLYDCDLRGRPGKKLIEVNASGKEEGVIAVVQPEPGKDVQLALDTELQLAAYTALKGRKGVVIATKPTTGELLVFASSPSYNPEFFENGDRRVESYFSDKDKPMLNRITEATYQPGSVFKPLLAAGGLEDGVISKTDTIQDDGFITAGPLKFGNWYYLQYGKTEGPVDVVKALRRSNDIYFYKLGEKMGPERMRIWAEKFGMGNAVPFEFDQAEGTLPSPFWKNEALHENWYLGDTYNYSIGQGYLLTTPLQIHYANSVFANNGYACRPQLLKGAQGVCKKIPISLRTLETVREGMNLACTTGGTGWPLFDFKVRNTELMMKELDTLTGTMRASAEARMKRDPHYMTSIQTGCKTGTAESHARSGIPHAWFSVFAPFEKPEIMITVLLEEAGQGSDVAAPVAKDVLTSYFERVQ
jgi:penicillin-binding protein 2